MDAEDAGASLEVLLARGRPDGVAACAVFCGLATRRLSLKPDDAAERAQVLDQLSTILERFLTKSAASVDELADLVGPLEHFLNIILGRIAVMDDRNDAFDALHAINEKIHNVTPPSLGLMLARAATAASATRAMQSMLLSVYGHSVTVPPPSDDPRWDEPTAEADLEAEVWASAELNERDTRALGLEASREARLIARFRTCALCTVPYRVLAKDWRRWIAPVLRSCEGFPNDPLVQRWALRGLAHVGYAIDELEETGGILEEITRAIEDAAKAFPGSRDIQQLRAYGWRIACKVRSRRPDTRASAEEAAKWLDTIGQAFPSDRWTRVYRATAWRCIAYARATRPEGRDETDAAVAAVDAVASRRPDDHDL